jgi:hypothetical protein
MKGKGRIAALALIGILILGTGGPAEARDRFYINISIVLGGTAVGATGLFFFFAYENEIAGRPAPVGSALLNMGNNGLSWDVPELVIRPSESVLAGPDGIEGYACLFKLRFP